jgi:transcriptional regulator with XRE-family HTH domain
MSATAISSEAAATGTAGKTPTALSPSRQRAAPERTPLEDHEGDHDEAPHPVDIYVGSRIRLRRMQIGLRQKTLASQIGVSFQAVQKYETGQSRTSSSRLYEIALVLGVRPGFFFAGYPLGSGSDAVAPEAWLSLGGLGKQRGTAALIRGFFSIRDPALRADILRLVKALGNRRGGAADKNGLQFPLPGTPD